jgi:hypothetical protein
MHGFMNVKSEDLSEITRWFEETVYWTIYGAGKKVSVIE